MKKRGILSVACMLMLMFTGCKSTPDIPETVTAQGIESSENRGLPGSERGEYSISAQIFPDKIFRKYIARNLDTDGNGALSGNELLSVNKLIIDNADISDLTGIELFTNLKELYCAGNQLTSLNLSKNTGLEMVVCSDNQLTSLDVSNNKSLSYLNCANNRLESLINGGNKTVSVFWRKI